AVGARLYIEHPELVRARLDTLRFDIEWMGLPASLKNHYVNYPGITGSDVFETHVALIDRNVELGLGDPSLFVEEQVDDNPTRTKTTSVLSIASVPAAIQASTPGFAYVGRSDLAPAGDIRLASRHLRWELTPVDFGHPVHVSLAATKARELAVAIANKTASSPAIVASAYRIEPPYTPTIKSLRVAYTTSVELDPTAAPTEHQALHVHPFGVCPIDRELPALLPRYESAGELYIGIRDLRPPQHLTLLLQLAEGTSDPDVEPAGLTWSYLDGDRFQDLAGSGIVDEPTRGLIHSGIVELALPAVAPSTRLPPELYWLRIALPRNPTSVCDTVAIRAQAVAVRFEDRGNAAAHYQQPLPVGSIKRLVRANPAIARIEQPYSSFGGRPAEPPELFDTRVSERLRHKNRALSAWDYERLVLHGFRQIYRAKCLATGDGIDVVVIPDIRELHPSDTFAPRAPANLLTDIEAYLVARAPAAARIRVRNARYVAVQVRLGVRFRPGIDPGFAQRTLNDDLVRFLSPWAFDDGAELMIGGRIYASSIVDFVDRRDDIDFVADIKLFRSTDGKNYDLVPPVVGEYHVATDRPDQVLVAAPQHYIDIIPEAGFKPTSFLGIDYARIQLDFIVG
ncbi:MAG TPA: baseplate J/gp47 family protein, partial [Kofleriaceae bacterium]